MRDSADNDLNSASCEALGIKNPLGTRSPLGQSFISRKFIRPLGTRSLVNPNHSFVNGNDFLVQTSADPLVTNARQTIATSVRQDLPVANSVSLKPQLDSQEHAPSSDRHQSESVSDAKIEPNRLQRQEETSLFNRQKSSSTSQAKIQQQPSSSTNNQIVQPQANTTSEQDKPIASNSEEIKSQSDRSTKINSVSPIEPPSITRAIDPSLESSNSQSRIQQQSSSSTNNQIVQPQANTTCKQDKPIASNSEEIKSQSDRSTKINSVSPIEPPSITRAIDPSLESSNQQNTALTSTGKLTSFIQQKSQSSSSKDIVTPPSSVNLPSRTPKKINLARESTNASANNTNNLSQSHPQQINTKQDEIFSASQYQTTNSSPKIQRQSNSLDIPQRSNASNSDNNISSLRSETVSANNSLSKQATPPNISRTSDEIDTDTNLEVPPTQIENPESNKTFQDNVSSTVQRHTEKLAQNPTHNSKQIGDRQNLPDLQAKSTSSKSIESRSQNSLATSPNSLQRQTTTSPQASENTAISKSEPNSLLPEIQRESNLTESTKTESLHVPAIAFNNSLISNSSNTDSQIQREINSTDTTESQSLSDQAIAFNSSNNAISNTDTINSQIQRDIETDNHTSKKSQTSSVNQNIIPTETSTTSNPVQRQEIATSQSATETSKTTSELSDLPSSIQRETNLTESTKSESLHAQAIADSNSSISSPNNTNSQIQREINSTDTTESQSLSDQAIAFNNSNNSISNSEALNSQIQRDIETDNHTSKKSQTSSVNQNIIPTETSTTSNPVQRQEIATSQSATETSKTTPESPDLPSSSSIQRETNSTKSTKSESLHAQAIAFNNSLISNSSNTDSQIQREINSTDTTESQSLSDQAIAFNNSNNSISNTDTINSQIQRDIETDNHTPNESQTSHSHHNTISPKTSTTSNPVQRREIFTTQSGTETSKTTPESPDLTSSIQRETNSTKSTKSESLHAQAIADSNSSISSPNNTNSQIQREINSTDTTESQSVSDQAIAHNSSSVNPETNLTPQIQTQQNFLKVSAEETPRKSEPTVTELLLFSVAKLRPRHLIF